MIVFLKNIFKIILYRPLFNGLILLYQYLPGHDFGVAIIVLTIIIRILLYPLMVLSIKSQKAMSEIQPKLKAIQEQYKEDKEKQTKEMLELYRKEKINPFSGLIPVFFQLPILIALYHVFLRGLQPGMMVYLYNFVPKPSIINPNFLGILNLTQTGSEINLALGVLAGISTFFQTKMLTDKTIQKEQGQMAKFSNYFFPIFTIFFVWNFPAAIGLYWITTTLFSIFQQFLILKPIDKAEIGAK